MTAFVYKINMTIVKIYAKIVTINAKLVRKALNQYVILVISICLEFNKLGVHAKMGILIMGFLYANVKINFI